VLPQARQMPGASHDPAHARIVAAAHRAVKRGSNADFALGYVHASNANVSVRGLRPARGVGPSVDMGRDRTHRLRR
jgi:hypothetical protein